MIKYVDIDGYKNLGEVQLFSHLYQFIETEKDTPMTILCTLMNATPRYSKAMCLTKTKTYKSVRLTEGELETIEGATGKAEQTDFPEFIKGTIAEEYYKEFKPAE